MKEYRNNRERGRKKGKVWIYIRTFIFITILALFILWIILKPALAKLGMPYNVWSELTDSLLPWLILLILLHLHLLSWKQIKNFLKRVFMAQKENLEEFGYISSGKSGGDPTQFKTYLNTIYNGELIDTNNHGLSENQIANVKAKINELDASIGANKNKIAELKDGENLPEFDRVRFIISMIIFTGLTIFSYFFYISTINKALFSSAGKVPCATALKSGVFPSQEELVLAVNNSPFILIVPFTIFALGWLLHIVFDDHKTKRSVKNFYLVSLLAITFFLDFLLASYIHKNLNALKVFCELEEKIEVWYQSTTFYIIIFMGFVIYIFWSLILHNILQHLDKKKTKKYINKNIEKLRFENEILIRKKDREVKLLDKSVGNIIGSIDKFYQGWNMFMNNYPERFISNKEKCEEIRNDFNHKISLNHEN